MTPYSKTAQTAIAAMSLMAEVYHADPPVRLSSQQIAKARNLMQPVVAKVLSALSHAGLVTGSPGPNGGYRLTDLPEKISLLDISVLFDRREDALSCPYGKEWCKDDFKCPLHDQLEELRGGTIRFLEENTLAVFQCDP